MQRTNDFHFGTSSIASRDTVAAERSYVMTCLELALDGSLGTVISTDPRPKGARLAEAQSTLQDLQGSNFQGQSEKIIELREQLTFPDQ
jgi:hypothetical protein